MAKLDRIGKRCCNILTVNGVAPLYDVIDEDGFIVVHDGTITDMFWRYGTAYSVTAETNTKISLQKVAAINKTWIIEMINLISKGKAIDKKIK
jgi:hypothetical protein